MGLFDFFSRKNAQDNDLIKRDMAEMKANIANLSEKVRVGNKNIESIYEALGEMLKEIEENSKYIKSASKSEAEPPKSEQELILMKSQLSAMDAGLLEMKSKINEIMGISRLAIQNHDEIKDLKRRMISAEKTTSIDSENETVREGDFSAKESRILNALMNSEIPLTYEEIASQVNISPITVKGYMNSIKRANPNIILENTKGRGRKAYAIKSDYRIKVLSGNNGAK